MIQLKSAYTDQTSTINKLLKDDFEPFAVLQVNVKSGPKLRMYFRKHDPLVVTVDAKDRDDLLDTLTRFTKAMEDWSNDFFMRLDERRGGPDFPVKAQQLADGDWVIKKDEQTVTLGTKLEQETNLIEAGEELNKLVSENTLTELVQLADSETNIDINTLKTMTKRELGMLIIARRSVREDAGLEPIRETPEPEENDLQLATEMPNGDGFRVVDEIPNDLTSTNNRTPQQDARIEKLKASEGNVSVLPGGSGGEVRVMAGTIIYTIKPDGNFTTEETGANTSALG